MEIAFPYFFFSFFLSFSRISYLGYILFVQMDTFSSVFYLERNSIFFFFYELPSGEYREISERRGYTYTSEIYVGTWKNFGIIVLVVINKYKLNRMIMFHPLEMDV